MKNDRLLNPDFIKAISILGVVFLHSPEIFTSSNPVKFHSQEILRFCVPCFIILWAYFFEKSYSKAISLNDKLLYTKKRFISLFKLYFVYSTFYFFLTVNWNTITLQKVITSHYLGYGFTGQYFFIILLQLIMFFPIFKYFYSKRILLILLTIIVSIIYTYYTLFFKSLPVLLSKLGDTPFILWVPYVFVGVGLAKNEIIKIPLIFILSIFLVPAEWYILNIFNLSHSGYITPMVLLSSILFCVSLAQFKLNIRNKLVLNSIDFFGQNTLLFFVINPLVVVLISSNIEYRTLFTESIILNIFEPLISFILLLLICSIVTYVIKKTKLKGFLY
ncbi:acyltransferase family protein [Flavobacterium urumqiense]|uniref:Fucose 4-O-acetylase n=1 Tax=Flavobacterium urumqiense TaxID=935224 RepID=A0A1H5Y3W1_9FLAO|nr:acyltransferase family protein [Flavobacterium urumqiense]SEG18633.1 Fucose 4-O-acetylase [Flavobacterium urumqiense]